ncbi:hypothetical protein GGR92_003791 [Spirosoma lacussanchae]|uniref:hypothetical protein n=1 Tax=Spirosoma lacussanchae TaxID=1884249 RepID=UPI0011090918|nr:hypothetical protein [Spirosoma lacussanchae]
MDEPKQENLHKEIDLIQGVIARMSQNAYYTKGWSVSLIAAVLAFGKDNLQTILQTPVLLFILLLVWTSFWYLDAYFLRSEQAYRKLYNYVIRHSADAQRVRYSLDAGQYRSQTPSEWRLMVSLSLRVFYGIPMLMMLVAFIRSIIC